MKIAIFGGAFDPPHVGHLAVVKNFLDLKLVDELWFLPAFDHPFAKKMAPGKERLAMLKLLLEKNLSHLPVKICNYELENKLKGITFETLSSLVKLYPQHQLSFLIGSDNLASFSLWQYADEMLKKFPFFVYPRQGSDFSLLRSGMTALHDLPEMAVSSTAVKALLVAEPSSSTSFALKTLLTPEIREYCQKNKLY